MKKLIAAAVSVLMTCSLFGCGKGSEDKVKALSPSITRPITDYFDGYNSSDPELVMNAIYPMICIQKMKDEGTYEQEVEDANEIIEETQKLWLANYGRNCSVGATSDFEGKKMNDYEIECAKNYFRAGYGDEFEFDIEEGYSVIFDFSVTGDADKLEGQQGACLIRMKDDDWKMIMMDVNALIANYSGAEVSFGGNGDEADVSSD